MGPLQGLDIALNRSYPDPPLPGWGFFSEEVLDRVAGQAVAVPVLATVAAVLAWRRRSWRPLAFAALAEACVMGLVGVAKLVTARRIPHSTVEDFFAGGFLEFGRHGISFPSGHAAEAVGLYGAVVLLLCWHASPSPRTVRWLWTGVGVITTATALNSLHLGYHWATDLLGGVAAGALALRVAERLSHRWPVPVPPWWPVSAPATVRTAVADWYDTARRPLVGLVESEGDEVGPALGPAEPQHGPVRAGAPGR